jgi:glycosyltransferase involved in cell wall biosynthesis
LKLLGIIITKDEELHISRCIKSLEKYVDDILIVDAFSNDQTPIIANNLGAKVIQRRWVSYSDQLNWMLINHAGDYDYVVRLDADEYINGYNPIFFRDTLSNLLLNKVRAISVKRSYKFLGSIIKDSEFYMRNVVRIFTPDHRFSNRLTDEKLIFNDFEHRVIDLEIIDENLKSVSSWLLKHLNYSNLEAKNYISDGPMSKAQKFYYTLPAFTRSAAYFLFRFLITQRFRGGISALIFVIGQSLVLRILVDYQISENSKKSHQKLSMSTDMTLNYIVYRAIGIYRVEAPVKNGTIKNLDFLGLNKWFRKIYYRLPLKIRIFLNLLILVPSTGFSFFLVKRYKKFVLNNFLFSMILDIIILADIIQIKTHSDQI